MPVRVFINKKDKVAASVPEDKCGGTGGTQIDRAVKSSPEKCAIIETPDSLRDDIDAGLFTFMYDGDDYYITAGK